MFGENHLEPGLAKTILFLKTNLLLVQLNHHIFEEKHWQTVWLKASCFEKNYVAGFTTANCLKEKYFAAVFPKTITGI